jgi:hypothetical protein
MLKKTKRIARQRAQLEEYCSKYEIGEYVSRTVR